MQTSTIRWKFLWWAWKCYGTCNCWGLQQNTCFVTKPQNGRHLLDKQRCSDKNKLPRRQEQQYFVWFIHSKDRCMPYLCEKCVHCRLLVLALIILKWTCWDSTFVRYNYGIHMVGRWIKHMLFGFFMYIFEKVHTWVFCV